MAKKKKAEEHENLERWLVSYADFMTLLFATFVVLYALAQSDVDAFKNITDALRNAFDQNIFESQQSVLTGSDSMFEGNNGATNPVMLEYMSQKYEQTSYRSIEKQVNDLNESGLSATVDERGLVIKFDKDSIKFAPGSAEIDTSSYSLLAKVAEIIKEKFSIHYIEVDGHTDSDAVSKNSKYPSNWELSSARASSVVRFMIKRHNFNPKLFTAVGYAETSPVVPNANAENKAINRRVEIVVLKNKNRNLINKDVQMILKETKLSQKKSKPSYLKEPSEAVQQLVGSDKELLENVIDMSSEYKNEAKRLENINKDKYFIDGQKPLFME